MNILLVHGFLDGARIMSGLSRHLTAEGHSCFAPTLTPTDARRGLADLSAQLARFVDAALPPDQRFALVGYSMGALVSRHYLQERDGHRRVDAYFSIAGPHAGTLAAYFYPSAGVREMRPRSLFLQHLAASDHRRAHIPTVCYWSPIDTMIQPPGTARLPGAEQVRLGLALHPTLTFDRRIYRDITHRLERLSCADEAPAADLQSPA